MKVDLIFRFGKPKTDNFKAINLISLLADLYGFSKAEVKRKWKEKAFDIWVAEDD